MLTYSKPPPPLTFHSIIEAAHSNDDEEEEGVEDYCTGGYHPVHIGEVLFRRYVVIEKLGWGHFSTVWLCKDFKHKSYVAVKVQKSAPHYMEAAFDEVEILQSVEKHSLPQNSQGRRETNVVGLLNAFIHKSPYGNHFCMVFEILRCNLLELLKSYDYEGLPMHLCQEVARQVLTGLDYLHREVGVIHTDLKPENVMLCLSQEELSSIVANEELSKSHLFAQRKRAIQLSLGLELHDHDHEQHSQKDNLSTPTPTDNLTKNQKKSLKKKIKRQKNK